MIKRLIFIALLGLFTPVVYGQSNKQSGSNHYIDLAATVGDAQGSTALSYIQVWKFGKRNRLEAGLGLRMTNSFGKKNDYITAGPAKLTRSSTTPFLIFFAGQETQNWDTLSVQRPFVNALNLSANFGYHFNARLSAGFNIDLIGLSFGRETSGILQSEGSLATDPAVKPSPFNVLLTGDHDKGTLNSEFFLKYQLNSNWGVRAIYQFLFTEYQTKSVQQVAPDGTVVDTFRNKGNNFGLGVSYQF